jgi:uncharacterized protein YkwD
VVLAVGVVVTGGIPAGYLTYDGQVDAGNTDDETKSNEITTETEAEDDLNIEEIERLILRYTNEERNRRGLSKVDYAPRMISIAREHSANMARNDYIGHTKPSGETGEDRYESVCDYTGSGYLFGENVASAWHERNLKQWDSDGTVYLETEEEIAEYLVTGWMGSKGHRENILNPSWEEMVAGIYVTDNGKVYATQNFC